jgi:hypothetical protein
MTAHGSRDKHSKRDKASMRRIVKLTVVKVALVGEGARERLVEVGVVEQVIVATSSKEGIISAVKTALKMSGDVNCFDFDRYGLERDDKAKGTVYIVSPQQQTATTQCGHNVARSGDDQDSATESSGSESDSDCEGADDFCRCTIPLIDVAAASRSWTDHAVRSNIHCCFLSWNHST